MDMLNLHDKCTITEYIFGEKNDYTESNRFHLLSLVQNKWDIP
jgi:hypothetical protein